MSIGAHTFEALWRSLLDCRVALRVGATTCERCLCATIGQTRTSNDTGLGLGETLDVRLQKTEAITAKLTLGAVVELSQNQRTWTPYRLSSFSISMGILHLVLEPTNAG